MEDLLQRHVNHAKSVRARYAHNIFLPFNYLFSLHFGYSTCQWKFELQTSSVPWSVTLHMQESYKCSFLKILPPQFFVGR